MSKKANPTLIGAFVLGAIALAVIATLMLAGGTWFGEKRQHVLYFERAAQGLQVGAPVVFLGVKVGTVKEIQVGIEQNGLRFLVPVTIEIEPHVVHTRGGEPVELRDPATVRRLVERGLRGQLRIQSLLTGQLYVDLDFHPDKPAHYAVLDPELSEIPTILTVVEEITTKVEDFAVDKFLADVAAISGAVNKLMTARATQELPQRLDATLRHLESLAARLDVQSKPILRDVVDELGEMRKALQAAQAALAKVDTAAEQVTSLASPNSQMVANMVRASDELANAAASLRSLTAQESPMVANMVRASDELANAAVSLRSLTAQESPTVQQVNATLKEISRAAAALRVLAELLEEQPDAIYRGKRQK